jgi:hypothetical protein
MNNVQEEQIPQGELGKRVQDQVSMVIELQGSN